METLTSLKNPKVQQWRSLRTGKGRNELGAFWVEGSRMVREAITSGFEVRAILIREGYVPEFALPPELPACTLSDRVFNSLCDTVTPQGIAAVLSLRVREAEGPRLIALDGVQDPGNVGTIIRTADAAGFNGVILSRDCADLFSPKVTRATMGSLFRLGFSFPASLPDALDKLKSLHYSVISSQLDGDPFYERKNISSSFVLVIGNEGSGVSDGVRNCATHRLCLPMRGGTESLNAAVAAGIMMYELTRCNPCPSSPPRF